METGVIEYIVAFGGNLGAPAATFTEALRLIEEHGARITSRSRLYRTTPLLHPEEPVLNQPDYLNAVISLAVPLAPEELLRLLQEVERKLGRDRSLEARRWAPRLIDLDIIAAGERVHRSDRLTIPHPEMHRRRFVLEPLAEIAPDWVHPLLRQTAAELLRSLDDR